MGWQKAAKVLEKETEAAVGQASPHTYNSSSYSFGGQAAITRSIQSCGEKVCDSGACSGIDGGSAFDTLFPFLGTAAQGQLARTFFPWEGVPRWGWRTSWWGWASLCSPMVWGSFQSLRLQNHRGQGCQALE